MPTPKRRQPLAVIARLLAEPHRFGFFQAVRLLDRWFGKRERGGSAAVLSNRLRFRNTLSLSFPASEIAELKVVAAAPAVLDVELPTVAAALDAVVDATQASTSDAPQAGEPPRRESIDHIEITPAFMGLLGAGGALPTFYTELLAERETYHRDTAARAFLDIFQHRAVALFYQRLAQAPAAGAVRGRPAASTTCRWCWRSAGMGHRGAARPAARCPKAVSPTTRWPTSAGLLQHAAGLGRARSSSCSPSTSACR